MSGSRLVDRIGDYDHWMAFVLLGYVGGKMLWDSRGKSVEKHAKDPTRGVSLVVLSAAAGARIPGTQYRFWQFRQDVSIGNRAVS